MPRILAPERSLVANPNFRYYVPELNNNIDPLTITISSNTRLNFRCPDCLHEFVSTPRNMAARLNCPQNCRNIPRAPRAITPFSTFGDTEKVNAWIYPPNNFNQNYVNANVDDIENEDTDEIRMPPIDFRHNGNSTPENVSISSRNQYWFKCFNRDCGHTFQKCIYEITRTDGRASWCPFCNFRRLCDDSECDRCHDNSLASLDRVVKAWINTNPDKDDNPIVNYKTNRTTGEKIILTPRKVALKANFNVTLRCDKCFHVFTKLASDLHTGSWCGYCHGSKSLCDVSDNCWICTKKSFSTYSNKDKVNALIVGPKNYNIIPTQIYLNSHELFWFKCYNSDCGKEFQRTPNSIVNDAWCPCCGIYYFCEDKNCKPCFNKSFASHPRKECWSNKNEIQDLSKVFLNSSKEFIFNCIECKEEFIKSVHHNKTGFCKSCSMHVTEKMLLKWLNENFADCEIIHDKPKSWSINDSTDRFYRYDFEINNKVIIELNGMQHMEQVMNWKSPEETKQSDIKKIVLAKDNGRSIIHIHQPDVYHNKNNWDVILKDAITRLLVSTEVELVVIGIDKSHFGDI